MLSKEIYDHLNTNLLYKTEPRNRDAHTYHCKNWTFRVHKCDDNTAWMIDTYFNSWDSHRIQVTDDNFKSFEIVFDFRNVEKVRDSETDEYDDEDLIRVATDSGGYLCGHLYWKNRNTLKSKKKLIAKYEEEVRSAKYRLENAERNLNEILNGTHYQLKNCKTD